MADEKTPAEGTQQVQIPVDASNTFFIATPIWLDMRLIVPASLCGLAGNLDEPRRELRMAMLRRG